MEHYFEIFNLLLYDNCTVTDKTIKTEIWNYCRIFPKRKKQLLWIQVMAGNRLEKTTWPKRSPSFLIDDILFTPATRSQPLVSSITNCLCITQNNAENVPKFRSTKPLNTMVGLQNNYTVTKYLKALSVFLNRAVNMS